MKDSAHITWFHNLGAMALRFVLSIVCKFDFQGMERVPSSGRLIAATNHTSFLDSLVGVAFLRGDVLPIAKAEIFRTPVGFVFRWFGAFPVRRGEGDLSALKNSLRVLNSDHVLLIAPEGTRSKSGAIEEAHEGAALLAVRTGAPMLPVAMWGGKLFWHYLFRFHRTPFFVRVGEPLGIVPLEGKPDRATLRAITDELMNYIAQMLPPQNRGRYAEADKLVPRYVKPLRELQMPKTESAEEKEVMPLS